MGLKDAAHEVGEQGSGSPSAIDEEIRRVAQKAESTLRSEKTAREEKVATNAVERSGRSHGRKVWSSSLILTGFLALSVLNLSGHGPFRIDPPVRSADETDRLLQSTLYSAVMDVEAFRSEKGQLPGTLEELGVSDPGSWSYQVLDDRRYRLSLIDGARALTYDCSKPPEQYFADLSMIRRRGSAS